MGEQIGRIRRIETDFLDSTTRILSMRVFSTLIHNRKWFWDTTGERIGRIETDFLDCSRIPSTRTPKNPFVSAQSAPSVLPLYPIVSQNHPTHSICTQSTRTTDFCATFCTRMGNLFGRISAFKTIDGFQKTIENGSYGNATNSKRTSTRNHSNRFFK
jgi:hypothetical protein